MEPVLVREHQVPHTWLGSPPWFGYTEREMDRICLEWAPGTDGLPRRL